MKIETVLKLKNLSDFEKPSIKRNKRVKISMYMSDKFTVQDENGSIKIIKDEG